MLEPKPLTPKIQYFTEYNSCLSLKQILYFYLFLLILGKRRMAGEWHMAYYQAFQYVKGSWGGH